LLDAAAASKKGRAQSTFTSLIPTSCGATLHSCLPQMLSLDPRPLNMLEMSLHRDFAWVPVAGSVLELRTVQELEPGRACKQTGPASRNFAGKLFYRLHPCAAILQQSSVAWNPEYDVPFLLQDEKDLASFVMDCISFLCLQTTESHGYAVFAHDLASFVLSFDMYSKCQRLH